jgi:hypothetical protein
MLSAMSLLLSCCCCCSEVLAAYEDEVVLLQEQFLEQGAARGLPGLVYQLADLQVSRGAVPRTQSQLCHWQ